MNNAPQVDELEELAAFIDGKLSGEAHARMVARLADSEELYAIFAETVRFQEEEAADAPDVAPVVAYPRSAAAWKPWMAVVATVAAVLIAVLCWHLWRASQMTPAGPRLALLIDGERYRQVAGQVVGIVGEGPFWSVNRGNESCPGGPREAVFCTGVWVVDLHAALEVGDREQAVISSSRLEALLSEMQDPFIALCSAYYAAIREELESGGTLADLIAMSRQTDADLGTYLKGDENLPFYALGRWAEGARVAARLGAVDYFQQWAVRSFPATLDDVELAPNARQHLSDLQQQLQAGVGADDLPAFQQSLEALLKSRGTR